MLHDPLLEQATLRTLQIGDSTLVDQLEPADFHDSFLRFLFGEIQKSCLSDHERRMQCGAVEEAIRTKFPDRGNYHWLSLVNNAPYLGAPYQLLDRLRKLRARREAEAFKSKAQDDEKPHEFMEKGREIQRMLAPARFSKEEMIEAIEKGTRFLPLGFPTMDYLCHGGIEERGVFVIAARTGVGKTALAINIAKNVVAAGQSVHFVTLEMPPAGILTRFMQSFWKSTEDEVRKNIREMQTLPADFRVSDPGHLLQHVLSSMMANMDCDLFILDYFGLMRVPRIDNQVQELERVSHELKRFAYEHKKPIILLAQLNRNIEMGGSREPQLSDLRGCGALEQDASIVTFLWDKNAQEETKASSLLGGEKTVQKSDFRWIIRKNRNGMTGMVSMNFDKKKMLFSERNADDPFDI